MFLHIALSGLIFLAPIMLLASGDSHPSPHRIWMYFREGGWGMWLITLLQMFLAPASAVLGALMIRGNRVPGAILFVLGLGPFAVALVGALSGHRMIVGAISGESIGASLKARVFAAGLGEMSNLYVYGGIGAAFAMYLAGLAAALSLVAIDPEPLGPPPASSAWIAGPAVGLVAAIAAIAARFLLHIPLFGLDVLVAFGLLTVGGLAGLAARPLPALIATRNDDEAGPAWRLLLVAAFAFAAAMLFVDRAAMAITMRLILGTISGESIDPSQRARILVELVAVQHGRPIVMIVDAAGCLAAFAAPLVAGLAAKKKVSIAGILAAGSAAMVAGLSLFTSARIEGSIADQTETLARAERALVASGITLPVARGMEHAVPLPGVPDFSVKRDGTVSDDRPEADRGESHNDITVPVATDAALPFEVFTTRLVPFVSRTREDRALGLIVAPTERQDHSALGPYAGLVGSDLQMLEVRFDDLLGDGLPIGSTHRRSVGPLGPSDRRGNLVLGVLVDADKARLFSFSNASPAAGLALLDTIPVEDTAAADAERRRVLTAFKQSHPSLGTLVLAPLPGDTIGHVTALLGSIGASPEASTLDFVLTSDRAALERMTTNTADPREVLEPSKRGARFHDLTVSGRLPPEVVTRVLRQNLGRYRLCQRNSAASGNTPSPDELALRFTIDRNGSPGAPALTPRAPLALTACLDRVTRSLSFPEPEGGVVVVNVKLTLQ